MFGAKKIIAALLFFQLSGVAPSLLFIQNAFALEIPEDYLALFDADNTNRDLGLLPADLRIKKDKATEVEEKLKKDFQSFYDELFRLRLRITSYLLPGIKGGYPSKNEILSVNKKYLSLKTEFETYFLNTKKSTNFFPLYGVFSEILKMLSSVRIFFELAENSRNPDNLVFSESILDWNQEVALLLNKEKVLEQSVYLQKQGLDRLQNLSTTFVFDWGSDTDKNVKVSLTQQWLNSLELGYKVLNVSSTKDLLGLAKFFVARQFINNLKDLKLYKANQKYVESLEIPQEILKEMKTFRGSKALQGEVISREQSNVLALTASRLMREFRPQLPPFVTEKYLKEFVAILLPGAYQSEGLTELTNNIEERVRNFFRDNELLHFSSNLQFVNAHLDLLTQEQFIKNLSEAFFQTQEIMADKFLRLAYRETGLFLTQRAYDNAKLLNEKYLVEYRQTLKTQDFKPWYKAVLVEAENTPMTSRRQPLILNLMAAVNRIAVSEHAQEVNMNILLQTLGQDDYFKMPLFSFSDFYLRPNLMYYTEKDKDGIDSMQLYGATAGEWRNKLASAKSYKEARLEFAKIIKENLEPDFVITNPGKTLMKLVNKVPSNTFVDFEISKSFVEEHVFESPLLLPSAKKLDAALRKSISAQKKKDFLDILTIGRILKFDQDITKKNPLVSFDDLGLTNGQKKLYKQIVNTTILNTAPILAIEMKNHDNKLLSDVMMERRADFGVSQEKIKLFEPLLDEALVELEAHIRQQLTEVAAADTLKKITVLMESSMMSNVTSIVFPTFKAWYQEYVEKSNQDRFVGAVYKNSLGKLMTYVGDGYMALLLLHLVKWGTKASGLAGVFLEPIIAGMGSMLSGFTALFIGNIAVNRVTSGVDLWNHYKNYNTAKDLFTTITENDSNEGILTAQELGRRDQAYTLSSQVFWYTLPIDYIFAKSFYSQIKGKKSQEVFNEFTQDMDAFRELRLGGRAMVWDRGQIERNYRLLSENRSALNLSPDDFDKITKAYNRLMSTLLEKQWRLENMANPQAARTSYENKIFDALETLGKSTQPSARQSYDLIKGNLNGQ